MLKTTIDRIAKPSIPLILYGQLKGYESRPFAVLLKILFSTGSLSRKISDRYPRDLRKVSALIYSIYHHYANEMDNRRALALTKALTIPFALSVQMANFRYVESDRSFTDLIQYQKRTNSDGPTRMNKMTIVEENDRNYIFEIRGECCFFNIFSALGAPELTTVFCETDNAIFNIYRPDEITFERSGTGKRIVDGASACTFICRSNGGD
ncbi:L-2-amino-thiazoline-4-carboxylic acid hydrolase [Spirochaeta isovalerica]|uniref:L-2-amino-thiazoline-4-carboxylic acid hydrolase n=1 Tax=Spirochaeta isovalerica TaxID=150 RepID=A0A841R9K9_9SPIO|nr:L-2-amino-thiazoline-4-carboxylic acid hydrolase [Spirochaeta isovalerica]MBB6480456.1 hypothetical protein [Spirochaeta isovalerica]